MGRTLHRRKSNVNAKIRHLSKRKDAFESNLYFSGGSAYQVRMDHEQILEGYALLAGRDGIRTAIEVVTRLLETPGHAFDGEQIRAALAGAGKTGPAVPHIPDPPTD